MEGLPEGDPLKPEMSWLRRLEFFVIISAVSGGWRKVALDTASLWSFITYQVGMSRATDVLRMKIFKQFLSRSKDALIDLSIVLDKRRLEFTRKLPYIVEEHSHRCRSLTLFFLDAVVARAFFPLPPHLPALTDLIIDTNDSPDDPVIPLFPKGMECQLRAITINTCRLPMIESMDFCRVHTLNLSVTDGESSIDHFLRILSLFRNLRTLDIHGMMDPPLAPLLPITIPNITKITTDDKTHKWFLDSIIAPQLQHLALVDSGIPKSLCGSVRTLRLSFEVLESVLPIMPTIGSQRDLVAMHLAMTLECSNDALEYVNGRSAGGKLPGGTYGLPCPSLEFVRILMSGYGWASSFRHCQSRLPKNIRRLLEQRSKLTFEMRGFGVEQGRDIHYWLDTLPSNFGSRVFVVADYGDPTPLFGPFSSTDD